MAHSVGHDPRMVKGPTIFTDKPRQELRRLITEAKDRGEKASYRYLSIHVLGRGDAYVQQYLERGRPVVLDYDDRVRLAHHFGVDQSLLAPPGSPDAAHHGAPAPIPQPATLNRAWLAKAIASAREAAELWGAEVDLDREAELIARAYEKLAREAARDKEDSSKG